MTLERSGALGDRDRSEDWERALADYVQRQVASGELAHLADLVMRELVDLGDATAAFEQGL